MPGLTISFSWIIFFWWQWQIACAWTGDDWDDIGWLDKEKIMKLAKELVIDAKVQERQIFRVRENHRLQLSYEIGLVIGKVRERYKRMNDIYREMFDRKTKRTVLHPPGIKTFYPLHWIYAMQIVHALEVDVDKLIHTLELIPKSSLGAPSQSMMAAMIPTQDGMGVTHTTPHRFRAHDEVNETTTLRFKSEDELKQHYREKFNARNGRSTNWTLDEYYGVI